MGKLFELLLNEQLKRFLEDYSVLSPVQSDFRHGHSTITAVTLVKIIL